MEEMRSFKGAVFDMDGVITKTAKIHAKAWKTLFDDFLQQFQGEDYQPFHIDRDYAQYIDGKPRLDGIRSFLKSRKISLEEGGPEDEGHRHTVFSLGDLKNKIFLRLLQEEGAEVYPDTIALVKKWKGKLKLAVISSSKNCRHVLESAGALAFFDVRVDGISSEKKQLKGKPDPDIFLEASKLMGLQPAECIVFEDAIAGVQAGKKGGFGLVIGVARGNGRENLINSGADFVVNSLKNIEKKIKEYV